MVGNDHPADRVDRAGETGDRLLQLVEVARVSGVHEGGLAAVDNHVEVDPA
jgi:hypothetical protein